MLRCLFNAQMDLLFKILQLSKDVTSKPFHVHEQNLKLLSWELAVENIVITVAADILIEFLAFRIVH